MSVIAIYLLLVGMAENHVSVMVAVDAATKENGCLQVGYKQINILLQYGIVLGIIVGH